MKKLLALLEKQPVIFTIALSVILNIFIELLARRSLFDTLGYIITNPFIAVYNTVIILFTLSVALYFSKRYCVYALVSFLWATLGVVNFIVILLRGTPLSAADFSVFKNGFLLMHLYLSWPVIILLALLALAAICGIIYVFVKGKKLRPRYLTALTVTLLSALSIFCTSQSILTSEEVSAAGRDIAKTYENYGFACCFSYSIFGRGIDTPEAYSPDAMNNLFEAVSADSRSTPEKTPNIIFVQLESFFDPAYIDIPELTFSENPIPNFTQLKENSPSGFFTVPAFGGGTANTEFEVLSQLSLESFGLAEYPYTTELKKKSCETVAFCLKELGYKTHAMHNNTGTFYDRDIVYRNLGFDTFTPIEYMGVPERTPQGWAKDYILQEEIFKSLKSTPEKDFVFAVSVQGHGQYPSEYDGQLPISVSGLDDAEMKVNLEYYLWQIQEMDDFLGKLISAFEDYPEETVIVFYGDHLPSLKLGELNSEELGQYPISCGRYSTEYAIWSNFELNIDDEDLSAHMISSKVLSVLGINNGIITKLNSAESLSAEVRRAYSKFIAYDIFYGDRYIAQKEDLTPPDMRLGIYDITVSGAYADNEYICITGSGFNEYSIVCADGKKLDTEYISENLLRLPADKLKIEEFISVVQQSDIKVLGESNAIEYIG